MSPPSGNLSYARDFVRLFVGFLRFYKSLARVVQRCSGSLCEKFTTSGSLGFGNLEIWACGPMGLVLKRKHVAYDASQTKPTQHTNPEAVQATVAAAAPTLHFMVKDGLVIITTRQSRPTLKIVLTPTHTNSQSTCRNGLSWSTVKATVRRSVMALSEKSYRAPRYTLKTAAPNRGRSEDHQARGELLALSLLYNYQRYY